MEAAFLFAVTAPVRLTVARRHLRRYAHCERGRNRSPPIVLAYRTLQCQETLQAALDDTRGKRDVIAPDVPFLTRLARLVADKNDDESLDLAEYALGHLLLLCRAYAWAGVDETMVRKAFHNAGHGYAVAHAAALPGRIEF